MKRPDETQAEYEARVEAYQARQDARADRFEELAGKHREKENERYEASKAAVKHIPMGQPILVGHHSEKRHRRDLAKSHANMRKSIEHSRTADYYDDRAAAARDNNAISAADPEAIDKLTAKIAEAETSQATMKGINKIVKSKRKGYTQADKVADLMKQFKLSELTAERLFEPDSCSRIGFPAYALTNNNANIRRMKKRLAQLQKLATAERKEYPIAKGVTVEEDPVDVRIRIYFPDKPTAETRQILKRNGFKWSRYKQAWQRHLNNAGRYAVRAVLPTITAEYGAIEEGTDEG